MAHFDNNSPEYIDNGHYKINGIDYMSIWTFKRIHHIEPNNKELNGTDGQNLISNDIETHTSTPDFGNFDKIFIYPIHVLKNFYRV